MVKFLVNAGFTVVAVSDSKGGIHVPTGVNPELTLACKKKMGTWRVVIVRDPSVIYQRGGRSRKNNC